MIKKIILSMITLIFTFTTLLSGCANKGISFKESTNTDNKDLQAKVTQYVEDYCEKNQFSGTILVSKGDEVLLNRGYGMADYDNKISNTPQKVFEIGSLTKQFTATAILMLQEDNLLSVQDTIDKYIPDYPNGDNIKIYNLLTHTSGIPDYVESAENGKKHYTSEELIELFKNKPLTFDTGTSFEYSNSNYYLLGYIIEKVSNMTYEDYIEKKILKPLKMNDTGFLSNPDTIKDKAIGYSKIIKIADIYTKAVEQDSSLPYAAGEICSTGEDLYRWENGLVSGKLINKESLNEMFTPYSSASYGYGWFITKSIDRDKIVYHGGSIEGYESLIKRNINTNNMVIILSNSQNSYGVADITAGLFHILENK